MSFKRAKQPVTGSSDGSSNGEVKKVSGVKPWLNGGYLVSTGNRALDDLLGGGQALGTLLMVESDDLSCYGETILKYGIAQALSSGHDVLVMTDYFSSPESVSATLPYNQNIGNGLKLSQSSQSPLSSIGVKPLEASTTSVPSSAGSDETSLQSEAHKESGLKIAWQYEKYMMQGSTMKCLTYPQRYVLLNLTFNFFCYPLSAVSEKDKVKNSALQSSLYCCSYDLSRRLQPAISESNQPHVFCVVSSDLTTFEAHTETSSNDFFITDTLEKSLIAMRAAIVKFLSSQNERLGFERKVARDSSIESVTSVSRIFLPQLLNIPANYGFSSESARLIVQFLLGIKQLIRNYHATVAFTLPPHACSSALVQRLKWTSDTVLSVESFAGREQSVPYEFKEFCGLLTIERLQQEGSIASFRPPGSRFGIKRDSRKLHIEPLHLPPEETRTGTSGTAAAAAFAAKDGYAVLPTPDLAGTDGKTRIEIKMDHSAPPSTEVNKRSTNDSKFAEKSFTDTMNALSIQSPSKYLEKGLADDVEPKVGNAAARSIFARARAEGLLPQAHQLKKAEPPLTPGSACAPNRPGTNTSSSLDF